MAGRTGCTAHITQGSNWLSEGHDGSCAGKYLQYMQYSPAADVTLDGSVAGPAVGQPGEGLSRGCGQASADKVNDVGADTEVPEKGCGLRAG